MSEQIVLGIDGGKVALGYCVAAFRGQQRRVIAKGNLNDVNPEKLVRWLNPLCCQYRPEVIAIEDYGWYGPERSANPNAFEQSRIVGDIEGAALMWSVVCMEGLTTVVRVRKVDANRTIGLVGKTPKARVEAAIAALFPLTTFDNEHQRDAAVVCLAGRFRRAA